MGVINVEGCDISSTELMAHAFANSTNEHTPEDYYIRRGSAFVNEYARTDTTTGLRNDGGPSSPNHLLGCFPTLFPYRTGGFETNRHTPSGPYYTRTGAFAKTFNFHSRFSAFARREKSVARQCYK